MTQWLTFISAFPFRGAGSLCRGSGAAAERRAAGTGPEFPSVRLRQRSGGHVPTRPPPTFPPGLLFLFWCSPGLAVAAVVGLLFSRREASLSAEETAVTDRPTGSRRRAARSTWDSGAVPHTAENGARADAHSARCRRIAGGAPACPCSPPSSSPPSPVSRQQTSPSKHHRATLKLAAPEMGGGFHLENEY